jgi:hypothetical protein
MDIHLNPKIGRDWVLKGHRRYVLTPGQNKKRFVAGALNAATGKVTWVVGPTKASDLFCALVWKLVGEHRHARRIHLILDNYVIHSSKRTKRFLVQFGDRVKPTSFRPTARTTTASSACGSTCTLTSRVTTAVARSRS